MELNEIFEKIDKQKLKEALAADSPEALQELLKAEGIELSEEQLDYMAGGSFTSYCTNIDPCRWDW